MVVPYKKLSMIPTILPESAAQCTLGSVYLQIQLRSGWDPIYQGSC